jgi:hypothetical protein
MMSTTTKDSLTLRVSRVIQEEGQLVAERCEREPSPPRSRATGREDDMRAWGMTYGIAFGLQLGENPNVDWDTAAEDALDAARGAFARWSDIAPRVPFSPMIDEVLVTYDRAKVEIERALMDSPDGRVFMDRMQGLRQVMGMPEPAAGSVE